MPLQGDFNAAFAIVRDSLLPKQSDEDLDRILETLRRLQASFHFPETASCIEAVEKEKDRRQKERHHSESKSVLNRLHQEQMDEVKRLFAESNVDSDKKHAESLSISKEANVLSKKAIWIAVLSVLATIVIGLLGVMEAHHDRTRAATSDTNSPLVKETVLQSPTPQTVSPTPKPTATNLIETNATQKK